MLVYIKHIGYTYTPFAHACPGGRCCAARGRRCKPNVCVCVCVCVSRARALAAEPPARARCARPLAARRDRRLVTRRAQRRRGGVLRRRRRAAGVRRLPLRRGSTQPVLTRHGVSAAARPPVPVTVTAPGVNAAILTRQRYIVSTGTYITLHYITLHYITLHYITLHYLTLHYASRQVHADARPRGRRDGARRRDRRAAAAHVQAAVAAAAGRRDRSIDRSRAAPPRGRGLVVAKSSRPVDAIAYPSLHYIILHMTLYYT